MSNIFPITDNDKVDPIQPSQSEFWLFLVYCSAVFSVPSETAKGERSLRGALKSIQPISWLKERIKITFQMELFSLCGISFASYLETYVLIVELPGVEVPMHFLLGYHGNPSLTFLCLFPLHVHIISAIPNSAPSYSANSSSIKFWNTVMRWKGSCLFQVKDGPK